MCTGGKALGAFFYFFVASVRVAKEFIARRDDATGIERGEKSQPFSPPVASRRPRSLFSRRLRGLVNFSLSSRARKSNKKDMPTHLDVRVVFHEANGRVRADEARGARHQDALGLVVGLLEARLELGVGHRAGESGGHRV